MNTTRKIFLMSIFVFALSTPCFAENFNGEVVNVDTIAGTVTVNVRDNTGSLIGQKVMRTSSVVLPNLKTGDQIVGSAANVNGQWELNSVGTPQDRENVNTGVRANSTGNVLVPSNNGTTPATTGTTLGIDANGRVTGLEPAAIGTGTSSTTSGTVGSPSLAGTNTGLSANNSGTGTTGPTTASGSGTNSSAPGTGMGTGTSANTSGSAGMR